MERPTGTIEHVKIGPTGAEKDLLAWIEHLEAKLQSSSSVIEAAKRVVCPPRFSVVYFEDLEVTLKEYDDWDWRELTNAERNELRIHHDPHPDPEDEDDQTPGPGGCHSRGG